MDEGLDKIVLLKWGSLNCSLSTYLCVCGFSIYCRYSRFGQVSRKGSLSVPGSSVVNMMCGSMELRCS